MRCSVLLLAGGVVLVAGGLALAQSPALPATPPTAASVPAAAAKTAQPVAHRAVVLFSGGQLTITADNSSLNQILRDVSRQTGMKITGGVADQRVFGKVGPGAAAGILSSLLDGTGSNMLLRENAAHTPVELVLTPRGGGATPPGPFASGPEDDAPARDEGPAPPEPTAPPSQQSQGPPQPSAPQTSGFGGGPVAVPAAGPGAAPSSAPPPSTIPGNPQSPNGVLTPQQIFQQLQQLQQQQQQPKSQ